MTKVTEDMRRAGESALVFGLESGMSNQDAATTVFNAMTAAQDSGEPSFWAWEYVDGAIEQNAIYKSKEQCERHSQADKGKAIPLYLAALNAVQVDRDPAFIAYCWGYGKGHNDTVEGGYAPPEEYPEEWPEVKSDIVKHLSTGGD